MKGLPEPLTATSLETWEMAGWNIITQQSCRQSPLLFLWGTTLCGQATEAYGTLQSKTSVFNVITHTSVMQLDTSVCLHDHKNIKVIRLTNVMMSTWGQRVDTISSDSPESPWTQSHMLRLKTQHHDTFLTFPRIWRIPAFLMCRLIWNPSF